MGRPGNGDIILLDITTPKTISQNKACMGLISFWRVHGERLNAIIVCLCLAKNLWAYCLFGGGGGDDGGGGGDEI